jgi:tight adherence protein C
MFDFMRETIFWLALGGLTLSMMGVAALLQFERERMQLRTRMQRAAGTGPAVAKTSLQQQGGSLNHKLTQLRRIVARMGERFSVVLGGEAAETTVDLATAGFRGRDAVLIYAFLKAVVPLVALVAGLGWVFATTSVGIEMIKPAGIVIAIALSLSKSVDFYVDQRRKERLSRIRRGFPDMLELLVISSEAGLGPQPALHRVAAELKTNSPELSQEILQMVSEMQMTNDRRGAYEKLSIRVPLPEIGIFTQTLDQSDTYGTPFSRAMRTLIEEQRSNRLMAVEEKAARLPVLMTLPLIFCIMPAVFVVVIGPAVLSVIDNILAGG